MNSRLICSVFVFLFLLTSCGKEADEEINDAILRANLFLTSRQCGEAINVLETLGRQNSNARYLVTLASAYACRAGYDTPSYFDNDITKVGTPSFLGGMSRFSTSFSMTSATATEFGDLTEAINILLYAGGISTSEDPTVALRATKFSVVDAKDINSFAMYLITAQLGMFLYYHGDSSTSGVKSSGTGTQTCLVNYENVALPGAATTIGAFLGTGVTGSCVAVNTGSADLGAQGALSVDRLCRGAMLVTNLLDILPSVTAGSSNSDVADLAAYLSTATTAISVVDAALVGTATNVTDVTSYSRCVSLNSADDNYLEAFYALVIEVLFT